MRIGILGGTFNPPHIGHLVLAQEVFEALRLDKIFFTPTNITPHKKSDCIDAMARYQMTRLSVAHDQRFEVLDLEIKRGGTSFTIDTVKEVRGLYPQSEIYLIVGSDLATGFSVWKDFSELKKLVTIVVAYRKSYPLIDEESFRRVNITQIDISSSRIRELLRQERSIKYLVQDEVEEYIKKNNLYLKKEKQ